MEQLESLKHKIESLSSEQIAVVEELIDSLQTGESSRSALALSEAAFAEVWNDSENDVYDSL